MNQYTLLSYCGLYCGGCKSYVENSEVGCKSCREEPAMVDDCPTRACAIAKGFLHCGECEIFPCEELDSFYKDGILHHALAGENMRHIGQTGAEAWLTQQETEHASACGKRMLWFGKG